MAQEERWEILSPESTVFTEEPSIRGYLFARLREDGSFLASKSRLFRKNR
ncbi:hypothetical protein [Adlercreutzia sp.]